MSNKNVVLITGNAGFIGSHIADEFIKHKYIVLGIDNLKSGNKINIHPHVKFFNVDLNKTHVIEEILKKYKPQILIHNASNLVDVALSVKYPNRAYKDSLMTVKLLEKAKKYGVGHIIFPSSANVYGSQAKLPITEEYVTNPLSPYGLTKVAIEEYLQYFSNVYKIPVCIFRYFNVYGPRQTIRNSSVIPTLITRLLIHKTIHLNGGDQTRDFIYVTDIAKVNRLVCEQKTEGIYNIGSGKQIQIKQVLSILEKITQKHTKVTYTPKSISDCDFSQASIKKIQNSIHWTPKINFEEGLKKTVDYFSQEYEFKIMNKKDPALYSLHP